MNRDRLGRRYLDDDDKKAAPELVLGRAHFRPAESHEVLTLGQAAALLQVDPSEVAALAEAGGLPGRRIGGDWSFPRAALSEWLAAR